VQESHTPQLDTAYLNCAKPPQGGGHQSADNGESAVCAAVFGAEGTVSALYLLSPYHLNGMRYGRAAPEKHTEKI